MANDLIDLRFENFPIRIINRDGEPWFVLADVCRVLEITNVGNVSARLDDDEKDDIRLTDAIGREQQTIIVNESGLWNVVLRSDKPAAKRFKKWLTSEVIPSIRKTGSYALPGAPRTPPTALVASTTCECNDSSPAR